MSQATPVTDWTQHADRAARLEARADHQWQAKSEYEAAHLDASYREIARHVGKSFKHIQLMCTMVHKATAEQEGWTFAEAYAKAKQKQSRRRSPANTRLSISTPPRERTPPLSSIRLGSTTTAVHGAQRMTTTPR